MDLQAIGAAIQERRKELALSQTEVAQPLGMSRATLSGLENGTVEELGIRKVMAICARLGLQLEVVPAVRQRPTLQQLVSENRRQRAVTLTAKAPKAKRVAATRLGR